MEGVYTNYPGHPLVCGRESREPAKSRPNAIEPIQSAAQNPLKVREIPKRDTSEQQFNCERVSWAIRP